MVTVIGENQDPIAFLISQLNGYTKDTSGTAIDFVTVNPHDIEGVPTVVLAMKTADIQILNIPPTKYRWYTQFDLNIWETTYADRFAVEGHIRDRILALTYPFQQLATNYVWMYAMKESFPNQVTEFGTPIFMSTITVKLIYDLTNPPLVTTPP